MKGTEKQIAYATSLREHTLGNIKRCYFREELLAAAIQALDAMDDAGEIINLIKYGNPIWLVEYIEARIDSDDGVDMGKNSLISAALLVEFSESRQKTRETFGSRFAHAIAYHLNGGCEPNLECYVDGGNYGVRERQEDTKNV